MTLDRPASDARDTNPFYSNGYEGQTIGSAQCGNLAALTADSTFLVVWTTYYPLPVLPGPIIPPVPNSAEEP
jgi:hypothetical protein